jgi:hypothetical protein
MGKEEFYQKNSSFPEGRERPGIAIVGLFRAANESGIHKRRRDETDTGHAQNQ